VGFFKTVWQDAQPKKGRPAADATGAGLSGSPAEDRRQDMPGLPPQAPSNRIQEAAHVSDLGHKQFSGPSAASGFSTDESVASVDNSGHGPEKVSQQQGSVSFGTTVNERTSALVEESLSVDPIVTEPLAAGHVFDDILSSVNLVSLKHGLVTGEDVNRAASQDTEIRVPEQSSFVPAVSVFSRDLMDLSVRADERNFQHEFGDLDTSRASGLDTPSEYHTGDRAATAPPAPYSQHSVKAQAKVQADSAEEISQQSRQLPSSPEPKVQDPEQAIEVNNAKEGDVSQAFPVEQDSGPLLSEHQRYLQRQRAFTQKKAQQQQAAAQEPINLQEKPQDAAKLVQAVPVDKVKPAPVAATGQGQARADVPPAALSKENAALADKSGADQGVAAFNALSALARQMSSKQDKTPKAADNSVHIGRIDVTVMAEEAVKKNVGEPSRESGAGWASRHYLRRL